MLNKKGALLSLVSAISIALLVGCNESDSGGGSGGFESTPRSANDGGFTGFLWKPRSESSGNLVVLFPNEFRKRIGAVKIHSGFPVNDGNVIEQGNFKLDNHNGNRPHYIFNGSGGSYGNDIYISAEITDAANIVYYIPSGGGRHD